MTRFAYNFVEIDEATPRTEFHGTVLAEDTVHAGLLVMSDMLVCEGTRVHVYNVRPLTDGEIAPIFS